MPGPAPIFPEEPSFAAEPPKSKAAVAHQATSAAALVRELEVLLEEQKLGIEQDGYYLKMTKWLQEGLSEFSNALAEMRAGTFPKGINDLLAALKNLYEMSQMSAKKLGGPFGEEMGKGIKKQITLIFDAVSKSFDGFLKEGGWAGMGKIFQDYLENPSKYPLTEKDKANAQYIINQLIAQGYSPLRYISTAIENQVSSLDAMSAIAIAHFSRNKNNGTIVEQTMGKTTSQFWKVIIQMISTLQSGG